jgi:hypothetical protein
MAADFRQTNRIIAVPFTQIVSVGWNKIIGQGDLFIGWRLPGKLTVLI